MYSVEGDLTSGKSSRHSGKIPHNLDSSKFRAWAVFAIMLIDMNDAYHALCGCWQKLSKLTNQRVYQELVYQNRPYRLSFRSFPRPPPSFFFFAHSNFSLAPTIWEPGTGYICSGWKTKSGMAISTASSVGVSRYCVVPPPPLKRTWNK